MTDTTHVVERLIDALAPFVADCFPDDSKRSIKCGTNRFGERVAMTDLDWAIDKAKAAMASIRGETNAPA